MATTTAFVSPSVLVGDDVPAAAVAVVVVLVVLLLLVVGVVVLGMGLYIYFQKKGLRELINAADQFYQFSYYLLSFRTCQSIHCSIVKVNVYFCVGHECNT